MFRALVFVFASMLAVPATAAPWVVLDRTVKGTPYPGRTFDSETQVTVDPDGRITMRYVSNEDGRQRRIEDTLSDVEMDELRTLLQGSSFAHLPTKTGKQWRNAPEWITTIRSSESGYEREAVILGPMDKGAAGPAPHTAPATRLGQIMNRRWLDYDRRAEPIVVTEHDPATGRTKTLTIDDRRGYVWEETGGGQAKIEVHGTIPRGVFGDMTWRLDKRLRSTPLAMRRGARAKSPTVTIRRTGERGTNGVNVTRVVTLERGSPAVTTNFEDNVLDQVDDLMARAARNEWAGRTGILDVFDELFR